MGFRFAGRWFGRRPASTLENICLATDTSGYPVYINWSERHLLTIGESDAGKGSILANLLVQAEPFVQSGLVHLYGVDLKALELSMSHEVFRSVATDAKSALELVSAFRDAMTQRAQDMAGKARPPPTFEQNGKEMLCHRLLVIGC